MSSTITIGTAPDSWGVWFPSDPEQVPAEVFLREVAAAGYEWIELGPYGYLPKDPAELKDRLDAHGLGVLAGTVSEHLHRPPSGVGERGEDERSRAGEVGDECRADRATPREGFGEHRNDDAAMSAVETAG